MYIAPHPKSKILIKTSIEFNYSSSDSQLNIEPVRSGVYYIYISSSQFYNVIYN